MEALRFTGSGSEYFKIWIVNILLTIVTLGLYLPWAKVRNRRYFYANSTLADRNFEYHATGKQLFVGFLIGMVLFIIYIILGQVYPLGNLVLFVVLLMAIPWLIWRSLMFNMKVTSFSNVYFSFVGTLKKSYVNFFVYPILIFGVLIVANLVISIVITKLILASEGNEWLGSLMSIVMLISFAIAFYLMALIKKKNTEYVINGSRYGQGVFEAKLEAKKFLMINLKTMGITFLVMAMMGVILYAVGGIETLMTISQNPEMFENGEIPAGFFANIISIYALMLVAILLIMAYSTTRQRTYIYDNTLLDDKIVFKSTLRARDMIWVMFSNILMVLVTLGFAAPWAKVRMARLMLENTQVDTSAGFNEYITQKQNEESSVGDQIGDAFDVDVGVAF